MTFFGLGEKRYNIGEKPGKGTYRCVMCNKWTVTLENDDERLPPCHSIGCGLAGQPVQYKRIEEKR